MNKLSFEEVKKELKFEPVENKATAEAINILGRDWELSEKTFKYNEMVFITENYVSAACDELKMIPEAKGAIVQYLPAFKDNLALQRLLWHIHYMVFVECTVTQKDIRNWPTLTTDIFGKGLFYAVFFLSGLDYIKKLNAKRGIAYAVTIDTLSDLETWMKTYKNNEESWGLYMQGWVANAFLGGLYKLGRLQFKPDPFFIDQKAYRNKKDGRVIVFPYDGQEFRKDGQYNGTDGITETAGTWKSKLEVKDGYIYGNFISPRGIATQEVKKIAAAEWEQILQRDDLCYSVHIPATGPMDHAQCGESFRQAIEFFPKYFPEYKSKAFICDSWLFDPQLEEYLPAESNVIKFLKEFYNVPMPDAVNTVFFRVFGKDKIDLKTAPRDNSLRKAILAHADKGGHWRDTAFVYFAQDFKWGGQVYRKMWE
ncbi:MAG: hypothetical protein A2252_12240 [Elusimicrobia bacterium RIFOXYA2_FULL_39_19]|nr:MAG: hypothetical protein A2252_12240 [Elusimicrobia bacterium RIFOXYA2_FULL_39_19]